MDEYESIESMCQLTEEYGVDFIIDKYGLTISKNFYPITDDIVQHSEYFKRHYDLELLCNLELNLSDLVNLFIKEAKRELNIKDSEVKK